MARSKNSTRNTGGTYDESTDAYSLIDATLTGILGDRSARVSQDQLDKLADFTQDGRHDRYMLAVQYYEGEHDTLLTDRLKQWLERSHLNYSENICQVVVDALAERLAVVGVVTSEDTPEADTVPAPAVGPDGLPDTTTVAPMAPETQDMGEWIWQRVWDGSQGDQLQIEVHAETVKKGDSYLIVDYDVKKRRAKMVRNTPEMVRMHYAGTEPSFAVKKWYSNDASPVNPNGARVCRLNIYRADRIEKWFRLHDDRKSQGGWVEWLDDGDTVWPTPWVDANSQPLGLPVFHFANRPADDHYGTAEHRIIIPLQDRLNKELIDLAAVLDQQGWPQRWATGIESTTDLKSVPGEIWNSPSELAQFGQFDAASGDGILKSIESTMERASVISRTPTYMLELTGGVPSGKALIVSESGLVSKIKNRQIFNGNDWVEALRMASIVTVVFGGTDDDEQPPITDLGLLRSMSINVAWRDPHTADELQHIQTLQGWQALGVPDEYLWTKLEGVDVETIRRMKQASDVSNAANMMNAFNRGGDTNPAIDGQGVVQ